jgi:hypothetical protein
MTLNERKKVVSEIKELAKQEDLDAIMEQLDERITEYRRLFEDERREKLQAFISDGDKPEDFEMPKSEEDHLFDQLIVLIKDKRKKYLEQKRKSEQNNADLKRELLKEFEALLQNDENIGKSFETFYAIKDRWKAIGSVPATQYRDLQHAFHQNCEQFYYDIKIYKELQQHDLKKNLELKRDLLERMTRLLEEKSIKETEVLLKAYQVEWDDIGPTFQEEWVKVREEYYALVKQLGEKISAHFKTIRDRQKENLQAKQELIAALKQLIEEKPSTPEVWRTATEKVEEIQENWKKVGFALKSKNNDVWKDFKTALNAFYEERKQFFSEAREQYAEVEQRKKDLIDRVGVLLDTTANAAEINWKDATETVKQLQNDWKKSGVMMRGAEQKYFKKFRARCDAFFEKKAAFFKAIEVQKDMAAEELKTFFESVEQSEALTKAESARDASLRILEDWKAKSADWGHQAEKAGDKLFAILEKSIVKAGITADDAAAFLMEQRMGQSANKEEALAAISRESKQLHNVLDKLKMEKQESEHALALFSGNQKHPVFLETGKRIADLEKRMVEVEKRLKLLKDMRKNVQSKNPQE